MSETTLENLRAELVSLDLTEAELRADPSMASCCLKEIKERKEVAILKQKLLAHDPTQLQQNARMAAVQRRQQSMQGTDGGTDDNEYDERHALDVIRIRRLQEMQLQAQARAQGLQQGHGQVADVPESQLLERLQSCDGCCVCHLAVTGYQPCDELDQQLEALAHQWRGTCFLRCAAGRRSSLYTALGVPGPPMLICIRNGLVIGRTPLEMFGPGGEIFEEEVFRYLRRLSVLRSQLPNVATRTARRLGTSGHVSIDKRVKADNGVACLNVSNKDRGTAGEEDEEEEGLDESDDDELSNDSRMPPPCETCGRCYPHTHVKAVYASHVTHSSEDDDD